MSDTPTTYLEEQIARMEGALASRRSDAEKRSLLDWAFSAWQERYSRFIASEGDSEKPALSSFGAPTPTDFVCIIGEISKRRHALQTSEAVA